MIISADRIAYEILHDIYIYIYEYIYVLYPNHVFIE
jgi:hypothetical protein